MAELSEYVNTGGLQVVKPPCKHGRCIQVRGDNLDYWLQHLAIRFLNSIKVKPRCNHERCIATRGRNIDYCILYELIKFHKDIDVVERHRRMCRILPNPSYCNICVGLKDLNRPMQKLYNQVCIKEPSLAKHLV